MITVTICKLLFALCAGYYLSRKNIFTAEVNRKLSSFILNLCLPLMVLTSLNETDSAVSRAMMSRFIIVGGLIYAALPLIAKGLNRITGIPEEKRPVFELSYVFSNNVFMGFPVAASLYGSGCIFQLCTFNLGFDILYFTYGVGLICKAKAGAGAKLDLKSMLGPGTIASLAALFMFFAGMKLPDSVAEVCNFLGDLASPLSMVVIGANIGTYSVKRVLTCEKRIYLVTVVKLILSPALIYLLMTALGFDGMLRGTAVISFGMPVAAVVSMGCIEYEYQEELASAMVILSTVLAIPAVPVLLALLS